MVFAIGILFIAAFIGIELVMRHRRQHAIESAPLVTKPAYKLRADGVRLPAGLYYHPGHTWGHMTAQGTVQVGLDDFIMNVTGPVDSVDFHVTDGVVKQGEPIITIHQGNKALTLPAPATGTVLHKNSAALNDPQSLNRQPYGDNWLMEIIPSDWSMDTRSLLLGSSAGNWLSQEIGRLRDFFAHVMEARDPQGSALTLQDGGEVAAGVLNYQTPEIWKQFQNEFIQCDDVR